ncbi:hypothetical protein EK904_003300, partial [Melospiza melodia maxima]
MEIPQECSYSGTELAEGARPPTPTPLVFLEAQPLPPVAEDTERIIFHRQIPLVDGEQKLLLTCCASQHPNLILSSMVSIQCSKTGINKSDKVLDVSNASGGNDRKVLYKYRCDVEMNRRIFGVKLGALGACRSVPGSCSCPPVPLEGNHSPALSVLGAVTPPLGIVCPELPKCRQTRQERRKCLRGV